MDPHAGPTGRGGAGRGGAGRGGAPGDHFWEHGEARPTVHSGHAGPRVERERERGDRQPSSIMKIVPLHIDPAQREQYKITMMNCKRSAPAGLINSRQSEKSDRF